MSCAAIACRSRVTITDLLLQVGRRDARDAARRAAQGRRSMRSASPTCSSISNWRSLQKNRRRLLRLRQRLPSQRLPLQPRLQREPRRRRAHRWRIHVPSVSAAVRARQRSAAHAARAGRARRPHRRTSMPARCRSSRDLDPESCFFAWDLLVDTDATREVIDQVFDWAEGDCELKISDEESAQRRRSGRCRCSSDAGSCTVRGRSRPPKPRVRSSAAVPTPEAAKVRSRAWAMAARFASAPRKSTS